MDLVLAGLSFTDSNKEAVAWLCFGPGVILVFAGIGTAIWVYVKVPPVVKAAVAAAQGKIAAAQNQIT